MTENDPETDTVAHPLRAEARYYARAAAERPASLAPNRDRIVELLCTDVLESLEVGLDRRAAASTALARLSQEDSEIRDHLDSLLDVLRTERTREIPTEMPQARTDSRETTDNLVRTIAFGIADAPEIVADRADLAEFLRAMTTDRETDTLRVATEAVFATASDLPHPDLAAETLGALTRYPDSTVQAWSAGALGRLAAAHPDVVASTADELYPLLDHDDDAVQHNAVEALGSLVRERPNAVVPGAANLRALLDHEDTAIQHNATAILAELVEGQPDAVVPAVDDFRDLTDHDDQAIQRVATQVLVQLAQQRPDAITEE